MKRLLFSALLAAALLPSCAGISKAQWETIAANAAQAALASAAADVSAKQARRVQP